MEGEERKGSACDEMGWAQRSSLRSKGKGVGRVTSAKLGAKAEEEAERKDSFILFSGKHLKA